MTDQDYQDCDQKRCRMSRDEDYNACLPIELSEAKEGCRRMMIHVQEGWKRINRPSARQVPTQLQT